MVDNREKHGLLKWGYMYYPNNCLENKKKCKLQMILHGCNLNAISMLRERGPIGHANDIILVAP